MVLAHRPLPKPPQPGTVPLDNSPTRIVTGLPLPRRDMRLRVFITGLDGIWHRIDLSQLRAASWRFGADLPNRIGGAARPADGLLLLTDEDGKFSPFNPHDLFDTTPGARVHLQWNGRTAFSGYSDGARLSLTRTGESIITIPLLSELGRLAKYGEGLLARISGNSTVDGIIGQVLDAAGWEGGRELQNSSLVLRGTRVNTSGAISAGRRRVELMDALQMLAATDGGYLFDREDGTIVYVSGDIRRRGGAQTVRLSKNDIQSLETGPMDAHVVNQIGAEVDSYRTQGQQAIDFVEMLPIRIRVPAGGSITRVLTVDPNFSAFGNDASAFIQTWAPLRIGTHYDWDAGAPPSVPTISGDERSCRIRVSNPSSSARTLTLGRVDGDPFRRAFATRLARRNQASIDEYGVKPIEYPVNLLARTADAEQLASDWLEQYSGLPQPIMDVTAHLINWDGDNFNVGDIVLLTLETPKKIHTNDFPFWIDAVEYSYASEGFMETTLKLRGAYSEGFSRTPVRVPVSIPNEEVFFSTQDVPDLGGGEFFFGEVAIVEGSAVAGEVFIGTLDIPTPGYDNFGAVAVPVPAEPTREEFVGYTDVPTPVAVVSIEDFIGQVGVPTPVEAPAPPAPVEAFIGQVTVPTPVAAPAPTEAFFGQVGAPIPVAAPAPVEAFIGQVSAPDFARVPEIETDWANIGYMDIPDPTVVDVPPIVHGEQFIGYTTVRVPPGTPTEEFIGRVRVPEIFHYFGTTSVRQQETFFGQTLVELPDQELATAIELANTGRWREEEGTFTPTPYLYYAITQNSGIGRKRWKAEPDPAITSTHPHATAPVVIEGDSRTYNIFNHFATGDLATAGAIDARWVFDLPKHITLTSRRINVAIETARRRTGNIRRVFSQTAVGGRRQLRIGTDPTELTRTSSHFNPQGVAYIWKIRPDADDDPKSHWAVRVMMMYSRRTSLAYSSIFDPSRVSLDINVR